jgi:hypothetical protein
MLYAKTKTSAAALKVYKGHFFSPWEEYGRDHENFEIRLRAIRRAIQKGRIACQRELSEVELTNEFIRQEERYLTGEWTHFPRSWFPLWADEDSGGELPGSEHTTGSTAGYHFRLKWYDVTKIETYFWVLDKEELTLYIRHGETFLVYKVPRFMNGLHGGQYDYSKGFRSVWNKFVDLHRSPVPPPRAEEPEQEWEREFRENSRLS